MIIEKRKTGSINQKENGKGIESHFIVKINLIFQLTLILFDFET